MKFKTVKESDNRLLNRREFMILVEDTDKTPKREDLVKQISAKMGFDDKKVVVDKIYTTYGIPEVRVYVKVYDNIKDLEEIESKKNNKVRAKLLGIEVKGDKKGAKGKASAKVLVKEEPKVDTPKAPEEKTAEAKVEPKAEKKE